MKHEIMWYRFVEEGGLAKAWSKLENRFGKVNAETLYWAFKRTLTYTDYLNADIIADAVAKRAASAMKRQKKEIFSLAKDLSGGICLGALA